MLHNVTQPICSIFHPVLREATKKAFGTVAFLSEDLKKEQDQTQHLLKLRTNRELNLKQLQSAVFEAEKIVETGKTKACLKIEAKCREIEAEIESERRRNTNLQRSERRLKFQMEEVMYANSDDKKNLEKLQILLEKLNKQVKHYMQMAEGFSIDASATSVLVKKMQQDLEETTERAEIAETTVNNSKKKAVRKTEIASY